MMSAKSEEEEDDNGKKGGRVLRGQRSPNGRTRPDQSKKEKMGEGFIDQKKKKR